MGCKGGQNKKHSAHTREKKKALLTVTDNAYSGSPTVVLRGKVTNAGTPRNSLAPGKGETGRLYERHLVGHVLQAESPLDFLSTQKREREKREKKQKTVRREQIQQIE